VSAAIPVTYLVLEQKASTTVWATQTVGPNLFGIAAYVSSALAMIIGSLLRDLVMPLAAEESSHA